MHTELLKSDNQMSELRSIAERAFGKTSDANISEWFSFDEMAAQIRANRGACVVILNNGRTIGFVYTQQESPINGLEGEEKWVIVIMAIEPEFAGQGAGSLLLEATEQIARGRSATKMFVYTNEDDEKVIHFYAKNGYQNAGRINDYQYGYGNSAVFLLKHLSE